MDIKKLRSETPGTQKVTHFNNAGAALMPKTVSEAMINYLEQEVSLGDMKPPESSGISLMRFTR